MEALTTSADEIAQLVQRYLVDHELYNTTFFPETCRQESAPFHVDVDNLLWSQKRKVGIKVYREGAKTTRVRMFISKRIAYGISRTILYLSKSEDAATATIDWLKYQVENNTRWASFYGLVKGSVWAADEIEIMNTISGFPIRVIASGIHGQVRGVNVLDHRPDLIVCDDVIDEKTVNTAEQIRKITQLLFGSVMRSLTAPADNPDAMFVMIQTPLHADDPIEQAFKDPTWATLAVSCFVTAKRFDEEKQKEVIYNVTGPDGKLVSSWPARHPVEFLEEEKSSYIARNLLSLWLREMEVTLHSSEGSSFKLEWLNYWEVLPAKFDEFMIAVDPASSEKDTADKHVTGLIGRVGTSAYLVAYEEDKGNDIDASVDRFFQMYELAVKLCASAPLTVRGAVEIVGFQRQLKRAIEKRMKEKQIYIPIRPVQDKRTKEHRINQSLHGICFAGKLWVNKRHTTFLEQYERFPSVPKDDVIDMVSIGVDSLDLSGAGATLVSGNVQRIASSSESLQRSASRVIVPTKTSLYRNYYG